MKASEIERNRKKIEEIMKGTLRSNFTSFTSKDLRKMFDLYDRYFFNGEISRKIKQTNSRIRFEATRVLTS